jgi:POT family proton-dependent oligopeptide transporter
MKVITNKKGERVIVDPAVTAASVYMWFYLFINIGALVGQLSMAYSEKYVGFWLAYFLPTAMLCICPAVMFACRNVYTRTPPQGSVLGKAMRVFFFAQKGRWSINPVQTYRNMNDGTFWAKVKPSNIPAAQRPKWMTFDDQWVDEVGRGFAACSVFLWYPLYWLTYNQLNNNLTSQAAVMKLNGIPNDVLSNLDPFALIILIPICDILLYPALRRAGINFSPIKKITLGFYTGAAAMVWACVIQVYIYRYSECGRYAAGEECTPTSINVWAQTGAYVLIAISEIFASITSLEYAFTKAPRNMRSLVMAFNLFMNAISAAIGEAFVSLSADPLLVWNYGVMGVLAFIGGTCFWVQYRSLDKQEDELNMLPTGHLGTTKEAKEMEKERRRSSVLSMKDTP